MGRYCIVDLAENICIIDLKITICKYDSNVFEVLEYRYFWINDNH
jgi:hypothetical protein